MFKLEEFINTPPFSLNKTNKEKLYIEFLGELCQFHNERCEEYRKILSLLDIDMNNICKIDDVPFLPVRLFKDYELLSVQKSEVVKTMTSSGTTGQRVSKIFLDKNTSTNQTKVLTKITSNFLGNKRLPMLIIDSKSVLKDRNLFSARGAGILGFSMLGYDVTYALDENMKLDFNVVTPFLEKHKGEKILLFGFTFIIWEHFYNELVRSNTKLSIDNGIILHGGGWKKLLDQSVDNDVFKKRLNELTGINYVYNYYGMVEQTGSIFMECEHGRLHCSIFSDVIIRKESDFLTCKNNEQGLIQLISLLPTSYPGHSILTEDLGELTGEDDCPCGRLGKTFKIHGRIKNAEVRGCSDTYEKR